MKKWFYKESKLVQIILLLIPGVNWVVETLVRFDVALHTKKHKLGYWVLAILSLCLGGVLFGWIDVFCVLLTKHLFLAK